MANAIGTLVVAVDPAGVQRKRAQPAFADRDFDFEFVDLSLLGKHFLEQHPQLGQIPLAAAQFVYQPTDRVPRRSLEQPVESSIRRFDPLLVLGGDLRVYAACPALPDA